MDSIQHTYINQISSRLRNFKKLSRTKYNFSCPFCGDSVHNKNKARGYLLSKQKDTFYYCHNDTGCNCTFDRFLYKIDATLYNQYKLDRFKQSVSDKSDRYIANNEYTPKATFKLKIKPPATEATDPFATLTKCTELHYNHPALQYLRDRKIPSEMLCDIWYTDEWLLFSTTIDPKNTYHIIKDHPRLVFPFRDASGNVFMFQGRSLDKKNKPKYLTCKLDETSIKIFGQDRINPNELVFIVEGPIDSLFIENSIAMGGSDISIDRCPYRNNRVFILDREPRSKVIVSKLHKLLDSGERVLSWKNCKWVGKDINEMILNGATINEINSYIRNNIVSGLRGKLEVDQWKYV